MVKIVRTTSTNKDFIDLVALLDAYLKITDGDDHEFYNQYNGIESLKQVVVAYQDEKPVGCGAIKALNDDAKEVKRMYVKPDCRGLGIATKILYELESWAKELGYKKCILETGINQVEAIQLYQKNKYQRIPNYGQYANVEASLCFEKKI